MYANISCWHYYLLSLPLVILYSSIFDCISNSIYNFIFSEIFFIPHCLFTLSMTTIKISLSHLYLVIFYLVVLSLSQNQYRLANEVSSHNIFNHCSTLIQAKLYPNIVLKMCQAGKNLPIPHPVQTYLFITYIFLGASTRI